MDKNIIILFGPPGAGKGTQAELLSEKLGLYHFETSKILEENFRKAEKLSKGLERFTPLEVSGQKNKNKTHKPLTGFVEIEGKKYDVLKELEIWKKGELCSPPYVAYLVQQKIKELADLGESLAFSGSPRTVYEAERIAPLLKELYGVENIKVFFIGISPEQTIFRNSHRKICELLRHPVLYNKETEKLKTCPLDGSKLVRREGLDDPETIKVRLKEYKERTFPVLEQLKKEGIGVININGEQSVADVFKDISKELK